MYEKSPDQILSNTLRGCVHTFHYYYYYYYYYYHPTVRFLGGRCKLDKLSHFSDGMAQVHKGKHQTKVTCRVFSGEKGKSLAISSSLYNGA